MYSILRSKWFPKPFSTSSCVPCWPWLSWGCLQGVCTLLTLDIFVFYSRDSYAHESLLVYSTAFSSAQVFDHHASHKKHGEVSSSCEKPGSSHLLLSCIHRELCIFYREWMQLLKTLFKKLCKVKYRLEKWWHGVAIGKGPEVISPSLSLSLSAPVISSCGRSVTL